MTRSVSQRMLGWFLAAAGAVLFTVSLSASAAEAAAAKAAAPQPAKKAPAAKPAAKPAKQPAKASSKPSSKPSNKGAAAAAKSDADAMRAVWSLRNTYSFTLDGAKMHYANDDADWALEFLGEGMFVNHAGFRIALGDGTVLTAQDLGEGTSARQPFKNEFGTGTQYTVDFPAKNGLTVRHSIYVNDSRPFVMITLEVGNTGESPVEIAKIDPVVITPENAAPLGENVDVSRRHIVVRGPYPMYNKDAAPLAVLIHDRGRKHAVSLGALPNGVASSSVAFEASGASWHAVVSSAFTPAVRLAPGQKLAADPVWFSFSLPEPSRIDLFYSWAQSVVPRPKGGDQIPDCWVTVSDTDGAAKLTEAAQKWAGMPVKHVLVPAHWEGRPGSLQGASGLYPKDMAKLAKEIAGAGKVPGITVDPLSTDDGSGDWTARSDDGQTWLNLSHPKGKEAAVARMKKVAAMGFGFFAVAPSAIPGEVLKHFNMTRAQADFLAFDVMASAANGLPVVTPPAATLGTALDPWLEAASCSSRMEEYGATSGPIRIEVDGLRGVDDTLRAAMTLFGGPIELYGAPGSDAVRELSALFPRPEISGRPLDCGKKTPKLWQVHLKGAEDGYRGDAIVMFPGAPAWGLSDVNRDNDKPVKFWRSDTGAFLDLTSSQVPATDRLTVYGITPDLKRPTMMGASTGLGLLLDELQGSSWDDAAGLLKGRIGGGNRVPGTAYVYVPEGWTLKSGTAAGSKLKSKDMGSVIEIPVQTATATRFELAFLRN